jgi:hypothetical protein
MARRRLAVEEAEDAVCPFCSALAPRVYALPLRVSREHPPVRPACYFCYIRMAGIKPTRRQIVSAHHPSGRADAG